MTTPTPYIWAARVEYDNDGLKDCVPLYFENRPTAEEFLRYLEKEFLNSSGLPGFKEHHKASMREQVKKGIWYCNRIDVIDN